MWNYRALATDDFFLSNPYGMDLGLTPQEITCIESTRELALSHQLGEAEKEYLMSDPVTGFEHIKVSHPVATVEEYGEACEIAGGFILHPEAHHLNCQSEDGPVKLTLENQVKCLAATDACMTFRQEVMFTEVWAHMGLDCDSPVPVDSTTDDFFLANPFGLDLGLTQDEITCIEMTRDLVLDRELGNAEKEYLMSDPVTGFEHIKISHPEEAVEEYGEVCEQAGGFLLLPEAHHLNCQSEDGPVKLTLENQVKCLAAADACMTFRQETMFAEVWAHMGLECHSPEPVAPATDDFFLANPFGLDLGMTQDEITCIEMTRDLVLDRELGNAEKEYLMSDPVTGFEHIKISHPEEAVEEYGEFCEQAGGFLLLPEAHHLNCQSEDGPVKLTLENQVKCLAAADACMTFRQETMFAEVWAHMGLECHSPVPVAETTPGNGDHHITDDFILEFGKQLGLTQEEITCMEKTTLLVLDHELGKAQKEYLMSDPITGFEHIRISHPEAAIEEYGGVCERAGGLLVETEAHHLSCKSTEGPVKLTLENQVMCLAEAEECMNFRHEKMLEAVGVSMGLQCEAPVVAKDVVSDELTNDDDGVNVAALVISLLVVALLGGVCSYFMCKRRRSGVSKEEEEVSVTNPNGEVI